MCSLLGVAYEVEPHRILVDLSPAETTFPTSLTRRDLVRLVRFECRLSWGRMSPAHSSYLKETSIGDDYLNHLKRVYTNRFICQAILSKHT